MSWNEPEGRVFVLAMAAYAILFSCTIWGLAWVLGQLVFLILRAYLTRTRTRSRLQWLALRVTVTVVWQDLTYATGQVIAGPALQRQFAGVPV